jgi:hypothetical protein
MAGVGDVGIGAMHPSIARARQLLDRNRDAEAKAGGDDVSRPVSDAMSEWCDEMPDVGDRQRFAEWLDRQPAMADPVIVKGGVTETPPNRAAPAFEPTDFQRAYARQVEQDQRVAEQIAAEIERAWHAWICEGIAEVFSHDRHMMRQHVAGEVEKLREEIAALKAIVHGDVKALPAKREVA